MALPGQQLDIIRELSDSYAPDLASNLSTASSSDFTRQLSHSSNNHSNYDRKSPTRKLNDMNDDKIRPVPVFNEYDQVMPAEEPKLNFSDNLPSEQ
jgi:hypothetical protein